MIDRPESISVPNGLLLSEVGRLLAEGHEVILATKGNSMLPFIVGERDSVLLLKTPEPKVRDIALAEVSPGNFVLHRIVSIDGDKVTLMGDGNLRGCEKCRKQDILGVVQAIIKPSGKQIAPPSGKIWLCLKPLRRYILGIYRRLPFTMA